MLSTVCSIIRHTFCRQWRRKVLRFKVGYVMSLLRRYSAKLCRITLGFAAMALGMAIAKQSYCLSPWNILNDGISHTFSITIGQANNIVGLVILALDLLLRETFGFGMLLNILLLGTFTDIFLWLNGVFSIMPKIQSVPLQMVFCLLSLILNGFGMYLYMSARMGAGPRDTLLVFLTKHVPLPIGICKLAVEAVVCFTGWLIGGEVGIGSFLYVLLGGPILQFFLHLFHFDVKAAKSESILDTWQILCRRKQPEAR